MRRVDSSRTAGGRGCDDDQASQRGDGSVGSATIELLEQYTEPVRSSACALHVPPTPRCCACTTPSGAASSLAGSVALDWLSALAAALDAVDSSPLPQMRALAAIRDALPEPDDTQADVAWSTSSGLATLQADGRLPAERARAHRQR